MTKVQLGQLVMTKNAATSLKALDVMKALSRFARGDWGDMDEEDKKSNDWALKNGGRLFGAYHDQNGTKFWIITEADRSVTTVLLPEDY